MLCSPLPKWGAEQRGRIATATLALPTGTELLGWIATATLVLLPATELAALAVVGMVEVVDKLGLAGTVVADRTPEVEVDQSVLGRRLVEGCSCYTREENRRIQRASYLCPYLQYGPGGPDLTSRWTCSAGTGSAEAPFPLRQT